MTSPQQLEILDIRHFTAKQLRPLLTEEAALWTQRLRWDYHSSTELLLSYLDSRILPGFVAMNAGRIIGFCFCVYEGQKAVIGDIYVEAASPNRLAIVHTLTRHLLETLDASPDINRIEAQLLLYDEGVLPAAFGRSYTVFPRLFLEATLPPPGPAQIFGQQFELRRWTPGFYDPTAGLIHAAYAGHVDSDINDQYRTLAGSLRFLHNIIRFPGCGTFDPDCSWVLLHKRTHTLVAVILCSRVAPDVGHITQLCVGPDFRGQQLGRRLLRECIRSLSPAGYRALTLTVSRANDSALRMYLEEGFKARHSFDAMVHMKSKPLHTLRLVPLR